MAAILTNVTSFVTAAVGWVGSFVDCIVAQPLLEMFVITSFVGLGIDRPTTLQMTEHEINHIR